MVIGNPILNRFNSELSFFPTGYQAQAVLIYSWERTEGFKLFPTLYAMRESECNEIDRNSNVVLRHFIPSRYSCLHEHTDNKYAVIWISALARISDSFSNCFKINSWKLQVSWNRWKSSSTPPQKKTRNWHLHVRHSPFPYEISVFVTIFTFDISFILWSAEQQNSPAEDRKWITRSIIISVKSFGTQIP